MTDETKAPEVVDLDAGQGFGADTVKLMRPFKHKGQVYRDIRVRVPNGRDVQRYLGGVRRDAIGLMTDLTELSEDVFDAMYAGDRNAVDAAVGKHLAGVPATSTTSSPTSASPSPGPTPS